MVIGYAISPMKSTPTNSQREGRTHSGGAVPRAFSGGIERPRAHTV